jgi:hypothetical protein
MILKSKWMHLQSMQWWFSLQSPQVLTENRNVNYQTEDNHQHLLELNKIRYHWLLNIDVSSYLRIEGKTIITSWPLKELLILKWDLQSLSH